LDIDNSYEKAQLFLTSPDLLSGRINLTIEELASGHCAPCVNVKAFTVDEADKALAPLSGWVIRDGAIEKEFRFKSYLAGLDFAYSIGKIAELENHHPDLFIGWRRVKVALSTYAIKGLSQNDFVMAAKAELEYSRTHGQKGAASV
jgi:4a-hydroxytetrahydrobiopterin dehydratase